MNPQEEQFKNDVAGNIRGLGADHRVKEASLAWIRETARHKYTYNFRWLGRPIIQLPQDIVAMQEVVWSLQPDLIIETGIAHGGSLILYSSLLELNSLCGGPADAEVIGIDIDIRAHNRAAIEAHPMAKRISMIQGSSISPEVIAQVSRRASTKKSVLVCLDSSHTRAHVLAELEAYAPMASPGSYCVVFDTIVDDMPGAMFADRPWGPGDNPKTAVREFLAGHPEFEIDAAIDAKLAVSVAPSGYLRRRQP
ncbi:MAG: cephalosporin hydroxylase family protein [Acidobacteriota bacterium]|nr:cephalosporin hydroxylase family protein [Acidobacteriota bacterium]